MKEKLLEAAGIIYVLLFLALILVSMFLPEEPQQDPVWRQIKEERMIQ